jgi:hypothetical protein
MQKSWIVIPAEAGIQLFQGDLDPLFDTVAKECLFVISAKGYDPGTFINTGFPPSRE